MPVCSKGKISLRIENTSWVEKTRLDIEITYSDGHSEGLSCMVEGITFTHPTTEQIICLPRLPIKKIQLILMPNPQSMVSNNAKPACLARSTFEPMLSIDEVILTIKGREISAVAAQWGFAQKS